MICFESLKNFQTSVGDTWSLILPLLSGMPRTEVISQISSQSVQGLLEACFTFPFHIADIFFWAVLTLLRLFFFFNCYFTWFYFFFFFKMVPWLYTQHSGNSLNNFWVNSILNNCHLYNCTTNCLGHATPRFGWVLTSPSPKCPFVKTQGPVSSLGWWVSRMPRAHDVSGTGHKMAVFQNIVLLGRKTWELGWRSERGVHGRRLSGLMLRSVSKWFETKSCMLYWGKDNTSRPWYILCLELNHFI